MASQESDKIAEDVSLPKPAETLSPETLSPETLSPETPPPETPPPETQPPETQPPETLPPETLPPENKPIDLYLSDQANLATQGSEADHADFARPTYADQASPAIDPEYATESGYTCHATEHLTVATEPPPPALPEEPAKNIPSVETNEPEAEEDGNAKVMSVIDHLDELRTRLIRCLCVFVVAMAVTFTFGRDIINFLELPGKGMTFRALSIEEPVLVYFKVSFYAAIVLAAPYLLYEISAFIAPGLKRKERRILAPIVIGGPLLFVAGAAFAYYMALPPMLYFFNSFGAPIAPIQQRLDYYVSLVTAMLFYMGICFQLPIILFALSLAGIINSRQLLSVWRYAVFAASVVAAIITPDPTVVSMLIVMAALVALYFSTIVLLKVFGR